MEINHEHNGARAATADFLAHRALALYYSGVPKSDIARQVREIYEERPYPTPGQNFVAKSRQQLPPFEWIRSMCALRQPSPKRILVAGCGTGAEAFALQKRFLDAEIVGVDFSSSSVLQAKVLQKRVLPGSRMRLLVGDLTDGKFMNSLGNNFDFISCHGVLSYIPQRARALRNISRCLGADGALYLGVNSAAHFSVKGRPALRALGLELPVMVDDVISTDPNHPGNQRAGLGAVTLERPIDLQENLLSQILGLVKSSRETVSQVIDPLMVLANDAFPGAMLA